MTNVEHEIANFTAKLAKATYDLNEDFKRLSPEAQRKIEKEAQNFLNNYSLQNVLDRLSGQAQR